MVGGFLSIIHLDKVLEASTRVCSNETLHVHCKRWLLLYNGITTAVQSAMYLGPTAALAAALYPMPAEP